MSGNQIPNASYHRSANVFDYGHVEAFKREVWAPEYQASPTSSQFDVRHSTISHTGGDQSQEPSPSFLDSGDLPHWAEMKTKAGRDRKRLPLACIACRRKKIKCSGEKPTCQHCMKSRIPCVYKITQRRAAPRTDYMAMLDKRLKRMEDRVIKIIPKVKAESLPRAVVKPSMAYSGGGYAGKKRSGDQAFSSDLDAWATHQSVPSPSQFSQTNLATREERGVALEGHHLLPPKRIQEHLAEVYFDYIYGQTYFLLHKGRFMVALRAGTLPPYLILAVCAISARFSNHPELQTEPPFLRGEDWAKSAQEIALRHFDSPNTATLVVFLLLCLHGFGCCQSGRAWMMSGMAHRMSYALRLHKDPDHDGLGAERGATLTFVEREVRRRAMWACFQMDRFTSSGTERPMFARERYMHLPLPVSEELFQKEIPAAAEPLLKEMATEQALNIKQSQFRNPKASMGIASYVIRMIALWGRLCEYMNLGGRTIDEQHPIWSNKSIWHSLKTQLHDFQADLPEYLRHTPENLQTHASANSANSFLELHIIYNYCILFLHRFTFPIISVYMPRTGEPAQFLETGRQAALNAANTVSTIVGDALQYRVVFPFAGYASYVASAVHVYGAFSRDATLAAASKEHLGRNIRYLTRMKTHWGMFHFLLENLKDLYKQHADASKRGLAMPSDDTSRQGVYQYADWHERFPRGVSRTDYVEPLIDDIVKDNITSNDPHLQSVEDFFANSSAAAAPGITQAAPGGQRRKKTKGRTQPTGFDIRTPKHPFSSSSGPPPNHFDSDTQAGPIDAVGTPFGVQESFDRFRPPPHPAHPSYHSNASTLSNPILHSPAQHMVSPPQSQQYIPPRHTSNPNLQAPHLHTPIDPSLTSETLSDPQSWDPNWTHFGDEYFSNDVFERNGWNMTTNIPGFGHPPVGLPDNPRADSLNSELQAMWFGAHEGGQSAPLRPSEYEGDA